ncbi:hypothetical protein CON36_36720 [Bacillus cereus]|uniref:Uncharacterized protein n=1 Tax=Bacillus cereus TaxID=1396 RepID=A0A9X6XUR3_BACCE|nr:hypothetical protein [Bacillus cereus]PDZ93904.1 hypothetical protein CON36_36720 [Bacillus cereus]
MEKQNDFRKLLIEPEVDEIMEKVQDVLFKDHRMNEDKNIAVEDIWGENNNVTVDGLPSFFLDLRNRNIIQTTLMLHFSVYDSESSYEDMNSRIIIFDSLKPIYVTWHDNLIDGNNFEYEGLLKEGFRNLLKAVLMYEKHKEITIEDI